MEVYTLSSPSSNYVLTFFLTLLSFISSTQPTSANCSTQTHKNFIKTACNSTLYPQVCYHSLLPYASTIKTNPQQLTKTALTITLKTARNTSSIVSKLANQKGLKPIEANIIEDCIEHIDHSIDKIQQSLKEVGRLGGSDVEFQMSNIKTWMSAALTDENTCMDGFEGHNVTSAVKNKIKTSMVNVTQLTSNALAIINNLSNSIVQP